ncbi:MAG: four helix bundle protein [Candidatus Colwellbacteria bacterium]|nr:four helix bundle protein [Candidatus Colwellbacteria bacterium]
MAVYKLWQEFLRHFPQTSRYTLGSKIDSLFLEITELLVTASYLHKDKKLPYIERAITKLDVLKFLLQVSWEIKSLDNKKYAILSEHLNEVGRMLGGWRGQLLK